VGDIWWLVGEISRRVERIVMGFRGMRFVVHVRRFGEVKITGTILSEFLKAVGSCRLKE